LIGAAASQNPSKRSMSLAKGIFLLFSQSRSLRGTNEVGNIKAPSRVQADSRLFNAGARASAFDIRALFLVSLAPGWDIVPIPLH
jgi:hypothetical protein